MNCKEEENNGCQKGTLEFGRDVHDNSNTATIGLEVEIQ